MLLIVAMKKLLSLVNLRRRRLGTGWPRMVRRVDSVPRSSSPAAASSILSLSNAGNPLCDLPADVLFLVLYELDARSFLRCKQVCRVLRHLIQESMRLTYTIELGINGMVDGPLTACQSATKKLRALRLYNAQVGAIHSAGEDIEEYEGSGWSELQKAVARCACCPTAYVSDRGWKVVVHAPRSVQEGLEARRWIVPLDVGVELLVIDVAQNLLVLCEVGLGLSNIRVYLRSLGAQVAVGHPKAALAVLDVKNVPFPALLHGTHAGRRTSIVDAQIYGPYVAWKVPHHGGMDNYALEVWDWKSGILVWHAHLSYSQSGRSTLFTYTFIDMEFIAVSLHGNKVAVYRFATSDIEPTCPYSDVVGLPSIAVVNSTTTEPLFALGLFPNTQDCCIVEPSPCATSPLPPSSALFWPDAALTTIAVQFYVFGFSGLRKRLGESLNSTFVLLIPRATFLEHIERMPVIGMDDPLHVFAWREWGERGSVVLRSGMLPRSTSEPHIRGPYSNSAVIPLGSRIALFASVGSAGEVHSTVVDVNPLAGAGCNEAKNATRRGSKDGFDADRPSLPFIYTTYPRTYIGTQ